MLLKFVDNQYIKDEKIYGLMFTQNNNDVVAMEYHLNNENNGPDYAFIPENEQNIAAGYTFEISKSFYFRGIAQGLSWKQNYNLNGSETRLRMLGWIGRNQDLIEKFSVPGTNQPWSILWKYENILKEKKIREHRIFTGLRIEFESIETNKDILKIERDKKDVLMDVIRHLIDIPGEYDPITYEQLKPDYYHLIEQNK